MPADEQPRRRFEPPPWEREAFERFQREQAERQAREDLEAALASVRDTPGPQGPTPVVTGGDEPPATDPTGGAAPPPITPAVSASSAVPGATVAPVPDARVEAMLVQLRMEEPEVAGMSMRLVYGIIVALSLTGVFIIVQAALLFARARSADAAGTMLAATMSFVVLIAGVGFIAGAVLLFRKYHR